MNLNKAFADIRRKVNQESITDSCSGEGCTVHLDDIPSKRVVIDVEKEFDARRESGKRCDRMLFYGNDAKKTVIAVPIELKSGKADESDVRKKLENSLKFATTLAPDPKASGKTVYVPVLFHGRGINWTNPRNQQLRVNFRGKSVAVLIGHCAKKGKPEDRKNLARVLSKAGYL